MSRPLPHRLAGGQCRDCGQYDSWTAPDTCQRCAIDRMEDRGYEVVRDVVGQYERYATEMWREAAAGIKSGAIKSGRFYLMIGHNDGGPLTLPMGDLSPADWEIAGARRAQALALDLAERYPQVWVVTTVGCWAAVRNERGSDVSR